MRLESKRALQVSCHLQGDAVTSDPDLLTWDEHSPRSTIGSRRTVRSVNVTSTGGADSRPTAATSGRRASMLTPTTGLLSSIDTSCGCHSGKVSMWQPGPAHLRLQSAASDRTQRMSDSIAAIG